MNRHECFGVLARHVTDEIVVAAYSGAVEWNDLNPRPLNYFSIGAMGLGSSHGLGLALGRPDKRVIVLDGDGSLLMNLGSLTTIAGAAPKNFVHFVCRNGCYEANGGHPIPNPRHRLHGAGACRRLSPLPRIFRAGGFRGEGRRYPQAARTGVCDPSCAKGAAADLRIS